MQSLAKLKRELKNLNQFYITTLSSYENASKVKNLEAKIRKRLNNDSSRKQTESILRELILIRVISALETFLTDIIREVFVATKIPFMDKDVRLEFSQQELIAKNSPTAIYSQIINRETRKLTNGGFNEFIKYFKKRFNIDISSIQPGYKILNEYHDRRHILVHRLGKTDDIYRKKHSVQAKSLSVTESYLEALFKDIGMFSESLEEKVRKIIQIHRENEIKYNARYVIDVLFLKGNIPNCLKPDYQFWADDEYVVMSDILLATSPAEDGRVRYHFNGSDTALNKLKRLIYRQQKNFRISVKDIIDYVKTKNKVPVSEKQLEMIKDLLPPQPWKTGVHKEIAKELELSNGLVSSAIDTLIEQGVFQPQVDGKIIKNTI